MRGDGLKPTSKKPRPSKGNMTKLEVEIFIKWLELKRDEALRTEYEEKVIILESLIEELEQLSDAVIKSEQPTQFDEAWVGSIHRPGVKFPLHGLGACFNF